MFGRARLGAVGDRPQGRATPTGRPGTDIAGDESRFCPAVPEPCRVEPRFPASGQNLVATIQNLVATLQILILTEQSLIATLQKLTLTKQNLIAKLQNLILTKQNMGPWQQNMILMKQNLVATKPACIRAIRT